MVGFLEILIGIIAVGIPLALVVFVVVSSRKKQRGRKTCEPYERELKYGGALRPEDVPADMTSEHRSLNPKWKPPKSVREWEKRGRDKEVNEWLDEDGVMDPYTPSTETAARVREVAEKYKMGSGSSDGQSNPLVRDRSGVRLPSGAPELTKKTRWYTKYAGTQYGPFKTATEMVREVRKTLYNTEVNLPIVIGEIVTELIEIGSFNPHRKTFLRMKPRPYLHWHEELGNKKPEKKKKKKRETWV